MSTLAQLFQAGVKKVISGAVAIPAGSTSAAASIGSVSTAKAVLYTPTLPLAGTTSASTDPTHYAASVALTNATTVTATRTGTTGVVTVRFTVIEYH